ncbi:MAG: hypothetical protein KF708_06200 [Pirellulales bacterium]|nr:hypothetical protein [Pirellulales bacterium]
MPRLSRLALGTVQQGADAQPATWALLGLLTRAGLQVQHFLSRACFAPLDGAAVTTGVNSRHLDSWLMSEDLCRETFTRDAATTDVAVVEGRFDSAVPFYARDGGSLETLCQWLDLPRIAIVDVGRMGPCQLPACPAGIDAILLDRLPDRSSFYRWQVELESLWRTPVIGGLLDDPVLRAIIDKLPRGASPHPQICGELADSLASFTPTERFLELASRRDQISAPLRPALMAPTDEPVTVAVAYDEAFRCYFPDTLALFEQLGAEVVDFSPLRSEVLPEHADVVYLGCGHPERYADDLASNHCLMMALREHVCAGRRIYAEGGGLAYLCQSLETPDGRLEPMLGVLPAVARLGRTLRPPEPVELHLSRGSWLGRAGGRLRGYRSSNWQLEPTGDLLSFAHVVGESRFSEYDLVGRHHAIGSRVHLNFAVQREFLRNFLRPHAPCLEVARSTSTSGCG